MENPTCVGAGVSGRQAQGGCDPIPAPLTRNERLVYEQLKAAHAPMKAYDLLDALHDFGLRAPMTIYRALDGLQAKGLAQKVLSQNAFVCVDEAARPQPRAVITCRRCGKANLPVTNLVVEAVGECHAPCGDIG